MRMFEAHESLLVDLSPAPPVDDAAVRAWAGSQTVFVSSVIVGMDRERIAAGEAAERLGALAQLFERFGGRDDDPEDAYLGGVAASDVYLGLLGPRYGKPLKSGYSATHAEYNEAVQRGLRVSVWSTEDDLDGRQRDFLEAVRVFHTTGSYGSPEDLGAKVERRLREMAAEALSPWVKVCNAVFRATKVTDDGASVLSAPVSVTTPLRPPLRRAVPTSPSAATLTRGLPGQTGRAESGSPACASRSAPAGREL